MNSENLDYKNMLDGYLEKGTLPSTVSLNYPPTNAADVVIFNQWCLATYLKRLYTLRDIAPILVFKLEELQNQFFEKYYTTANKEETVMAARLHAVYDIRKITGNLCGYAVDLYRLIKSGREEKLFAKKFFRKSHEAFKRYALVYDLVKFKIFLEELSKNLEPVYNDIAFGLNPTQVERLYRSLRGIYICGDTKLNDFRAVFNMNKIEKTHRIKWVHAASRNKNQLNKSTLFELVISLNEVNSYLGKQLKPEVYAFINNSFEGERSEDLSNLVDAHRNYDKLKETNSVIAIRNLIANIKE